ncbi:MAG: SDR family oxidoreductase [Candidatus Aminicenantes bacterium]|nr:SDR family oxidoreductase [Candidatus Aminicenantes bacterium]
MTNKIALVTGSSRGIGAGIVRSLAGLMDGVAVHYLVDRDSAEQTADTIRAIGKKSRAFQADLSKENEAFSLVSSVEQEWGRLDVLVNNLGPILVKSWKKVKISDWENIWRKNFMSSFFCMKAALPGMRRRKWGRIVNIGYSRVEQLTAFPGILPYAAAKVSLLLLTRTAAETEGKAGVTVNMVSPGLIEKGIFPDNRNIPLGRPGTYKDVSSAVRFLVSEEAGYITGANLIVAGGWKL